MINVISLSEQNKTDSGMGCTSDSEQNKEDADLPLDTNNIQVNTSSGISTQLFTNTNINNTNNTNNKSNNERRQYCDNDDDDYNRIYLYMIFKR